jgi:hypothetical protein
MSANEKSKKSIKDNKSKKEDLPLSENENRNTSNNLTEEDNQENFNLKGNCKCNKDLKEKEKEKENESKTLTKNQKIKDSIKEYEKINKKISLLAELIENKFESKERANKEKLKKQQAFNLKKENNFKFYPQYITPNFIQSINKNELFLSDLKKKNLSDYTEKENENKNINNRNKKNKGDELIDIDDILEMENLDYKNKNSTNIITPEETKIQSKSGSEENAFRKNFAKHFSNDKKRFKYENKLVKDLSSFSSLLQNEDVIFFINIYINS